MSRDFYFSLRIRVTPSVYIRLNLLSNMSLTEISPDLLIKIVTFVPLLSVTTLTILNKQWYRICKSESLWRQRLHQEFPLYVSSRSPDESYYDFYRNLVQSRRLRTSQDEPLFVPINIGRPWALIRAKGFVSVALIYPVPLLRLEGDIFSYRTSPDILIRYPDRTMDLLLIGIRRRLNLPEIGVSLPRYHKEAVKDSTEFRRDVYIVTTLGYEYILLQVCNFLSFIREAQAKGYMMLNTEGRYVELDSSWCRYPHLFV